jgi:hypothetical protein
MKTFEQFWLEMLQSLQTSREVRNWTALQGYLGGKFRAISYSGLGPQEKQAARVYGFLRHPLGDWIICTPLQGAEFPRHFPTVSKKEFKDRYHKWATYKNNGMTRLAFDGETEASAYLISLFKEFDFLT